MTHNESNLQLIEAVESLLKVGEIEKARETALPLFEEYATKTEELPLRLQRIFGVFVAISNGHMEAVKLLDQPLE